MRLDQAFHHRPLAGLNFPHRHIPCDAGSERLARGYSMSDACTVDEVLARQAGNIGAGTAHIALLYDHDAFAGTAEMPRYRFSRLAAAEHHGIIGINRGHDQLPSGNYRRQRTRSKPLRPSKPQSPPPRRRNLRATFQCDHVLSFS